MKLTLQSVKEYEHHMNASQCPYVGVLKFYQLKKKNPQNSKTDSKKKSVTRRLCVCPPQITEYSGVVPQ